MNERKQKSYGVKYNSTNVKFKLNKKKLLLAIIIFLSICEIALGVLWALGY